MLRPSKDFLLSAKDRSRADGFLCDGVHARAKSGPSVLAGAPSYLYFTSRIQPELLAVDPQSATATGQALGIRTRFVEMSLVVGQIFRRAALDVRLVFARLACIGLPVDFECLFLSGS